MSEAKPFASLSSGLLARKGTAKPAMRPQGFGNFGGGNLEDLGWNDMGAANAPQSEPLPEHVPSSIAALTPLGGRSEPAPVEHLFERDEEAAPAPPPVIEQQREIEERLSAPEPVLEPVFEPTPEPVFDRAPEPVRAPAKVVALPPRERTAGKAKAAFTLRLDPDRHLKLRLACAVAGRSAQQIVTEALDEYLASRPELDALASHVPTKVRKG
jgi:hypothetical protein